MNDFPSPPIPMMTPERARDIARAYQGIAEQLRDTPDGEVFAACETRRAQWWLTYAIALAQTQKS